MAGTNQLVNTTTIAVGVVVIVAVVITIVITIATYITATGIAIVAVIDVVVCGRQSGRNCGAILYVNEQYKHANQCNTADVISLM